MPKNSTAGMAPQNASSVPTASAGKSSLLRTAFAPSSFQLHLFASVIQSFESQQLRIHDTNSGQLRQQHNAKPGTSITSLDWGYYGSSPASRKKRKRDHVRTEDVVVAYGTSSAEVCMYSPAEGRLVGNLTGAHDAEIRDFKFSRDDSFEAWSLGGDGKLIQWDLKTSRVLRTVPLNESSPVVLARPSINKPRILCASTTPFSIDLPSDDVIQIEPFDSFKNPLHSLIRSGKDQTDGSESFLGADRDRYLNIFDIEQRRLVRNLVAGSGVKSVEISIPLQNDSILDEQVLAVVTNDGLIELFKQPFLQQKPLNGDLRSKRKNMTRKANAQIKLIDANSKELAEIQAVSFQGPDLLFLSIESGVEPSFQKIRWQDEGSGELLIEGTKEVVKIRSASTLNTANLNGVKNLGKTHVDESRAVVVDGTTEIGPTDTAIEISSDDEADEVHSESEVEEQEAAAAIEGQHDSDGSDELMEDADALAIRNDIEDQSDAEEEAGQEPSFGDMLASKHPDTISIADALVMRSAEIDNSDARQLSVPVGMSLGTVLTQALRTNDNNLLESCLHANDQGIIQNTIQRLDSGLAAVLLSKLAERLANRPGRYGHLLSWVQWTCIAHGSAIVGKPDVNAKIRTLYKVLNQRSKSLDKLLLLKGKLDLLEAQLSFRKQLQAQRGTLNEASGEPGMIYIEGQDDNWSSEDDHDEIAGESKKLGFKTKVPLRKDLSGLINRDLSDGEESDEEDDEEEMPTTNGVVHDSSDEDEDDEEEESDSEIDMDGNRKKGLVDEEAEVSGDEESSDSDEDVQESDESQDEDEDEEDDSSMDRFINDGEISVASEDDEDDALARPATKRSKHKR